MKMFYLIFFFCIITGNDLFAGDKIIDMQKTHGGKRMLAIRPISPSDSRSIEKYVLGAEDEIRLMYKNLDLLWRFSSYGKLWVESVDTVVVRIDDKGDVKQAHAEAAKQLGFPSVEEMAKAYDFRSVIYHKDQKNRGGVAIVRGERSKIGTYSHKTLLHELGHNLGQGVHAGCWIPYHADDLIGKSGAYIMTGYPFGSLGDGIRIGYTLQTRQLFGWVSMGKSSDDNIRIINKSTKVRIYAYNVTTPAKTLGVLIDRPGSPLADTGNEIEKNERFSHYFLSFLARQKPIVPPVDDDHDIPSRLEHNMGKGLAIERVVYDSDHNRIVGTIIIDCNPGTQSTEVKKKRSSNTDIELSDCFLEVGKTFTDSEAGISIRVLAVGGGNSQYIDVKIDLRP